MFIKILLVICLTLFLLTTIGLWADIRNSKQIENAVSLGTLVIIESEGDGPPELYLKVENAEILESDLCKNTGYALLKVSRRKAE